jgi:mRNA interferase RelE/StbE
MRARYRIEFTAKATRELAALPRQPQQRILDKIAALADDLRPHGSKKLEGEDGFHRIRVGDYRIVYSVHDDVLLVLIVRIGHRREVYRGRR